MFIGCHRCGLLCEVISSSLAEEALIEPRACVRCEYVPVVAGSAPPDALQPETTVTLSVTEYISAAAGAGLPSEKICSAAAVEELFKQRVVSVLGRELSANRVAIDSIVFEDGTRAYLAPSTAGAVVYRIRAPLVLRSTDG